MISKFKFYIITVFATLGAAFLIWAKFVRPDGEIDPAFKDPFEPLVDKHIGVLEELDVKIEELHENGVEDLTDEEVVSYWEKN